MKQMRLMARLALGIAACGMAAGISAAAEGAEPIELVVWQGFKFEEVTLLRKNIQEYCKARSAEIGREIRIREESVPFDSLPTRLRMAAPSGRRLLPDVVILDANNLVPLVYGGLAKPLDTLKSFPAGGVETLRKEYAPGAFESNIVAFQGKEHLYGLPAQTSTLALYWNKQMFAAKSAELKAAGLDPTRAPLDWDEVVAYSKILKDPDSVAPGSRRYGFAYNNSLWFTMPFINQYRAAYARRNADGRWVSTATEEPMRAALQRKMDLYLTHKIEAGAWNTGAPDPDQGFINRKYAMILSGPWMLDKFRGEKIDFGVALIPRVPAAEAKKLGLLPDGLGPDSPEAKALSAGNVGGQNMVMLSVCKETDEALAFMRFFTSETVQREWAETLGQIPTNRKAQTGLNLSKFPEVATFIEQANLAKPQPRLPFGGILETDIFNPNMSLVLQGNVSLETALKTIERDIDERMLKPVNEMEDEARKSSK